MNSGLLTNSPLHVPATAQDRIAQATVPVRLSTLAAGGMESLRVLSESKFLELIQGLVKEALADIRAASRSAAALEPANPEQLALNDDLAATYHEKWSQLRGKHQESLQRIEGRMERLARVFRGLEGAVSRLNGPGAGNHPAPAASSAADSEELKRQLLREMLLRDAT